MDFARTTARSDFFCRGRGAAKTSRFFSCSSSSPSRPGGLRLTRSTRSGGTGPQRLRRFETREVKLISRIISQRCARVCGAQPAPRARGDSAGFGGLLAATRKLQDRSDGAHSLPGSPRGPRGCLRARRAAWAPAARAARAGFQRGRKGHGNDADAERLPGLGGRGAGAKSLIGWPSTRRGRNAVVRRAVRPIYESARRGRPERTSRPRTPGAPSRRRRGGRDAATPRVR